jgi:hypothetical protein
MRTPRAAIVLFTLAVVLGLSLALAATALAADGVRVIPTPLASPDYGQFEPAIGADILAYGSCDPANGDDQVIRLKFLWDASTPYAIPRPEGYKDMQPSVAVDGSEIYVVWSRMRLAEPWDSHIWIWKGQYRTPAAGGATQFIADDGFPRILAEGPDQNPLPTQSSPSIGLSDVTGSPHVIVAWEDTRDTCPWVPEVFWTDVTAEPTWDPTSVGLPVDSTGVLGRGQHLPEVGRAAIYWLDERFTWWNEGDLTDTAVYRMDLATQESAYYFRDTDHANDNGLEEAPQTTYNGAAWLRLGPYAGAGALPYIKPAGSSGHTLVPLIRPYDLSTYTKDGASNTGLAVAAMHADRLDAIDGDIFYFDVNSGERVPVCDRGNPAGATGETPGYYQYNAMSPEVGNAFYAYRIVWVDQRDSAGEDTPDAKLYEAFVPTVRWTLRVPSTLSRKPWTTKVTVEPDFTGQPVKLQRVTPVKSLGGTSYKPAGRAFLTSATMVAGPPNTHSSVATLKWTPKVAGTYYLRAWFPGASRYTYDGMTIAGGNDVAVPHVGNYTKVIKITVK